MKAHTAFDVFKHLFLVLLTGVGLLLLFFFGYLPWTTNHGETIAVPKVTGMTLNRAEDFLEERALRFYVQDSIYKSETPPGMVLKQEPAEGAQVKEARKIYLTVAMRNPPLILMPKLLDMSLKAATIALGAADLRLGEITTVPDLQQNAVLKQLINGKPVAPGDLVPKDSRVDLVVADGQGNNEFDLENVVGRPFDEVKIALQGQGLQVAVVTYQPGSGDSADGTVLRQRPAAGTQVRTGQLVDLWVKGAEPNLEEEPQ